MKNLLTITLLLSCTQLLQASENGNGTIMGLSKEAQGYKASFEATQSQLEALQKEHALCSTVATNLKLAQTDLQQSRENEQKSFVLIERLKKELAERQGRLDIAGKALGQLQVTHAGCENTINGLTSQLAQAKSGNNGKADHTQCEKRIEVLSAQVAQGVIALQRLRDEKEQELSSLREKNSALQVAYQEALQEDVHEDCNSRIEQLRDRISSRSSQDGLTEPEVMVVKEERGWFKTLAPWGGGMLCGMLIAKNAHRLPFSK